MGKLSIIIPTYNERDSIVSLIEKLAQILSGQDYEIVIIDDNSPDNTAEIVSTLLDRYPINLLVREKKLGLSSAVVKGFEISSGRILAVMDGDLQHPPEMLLKMRHAIETGSDLVIASRYAPGGGCHHWGLKRALISKGAVFLAHTFLPQIKNIQDPMSGFFMFRKEKIENAVLKPKGFKILLELLMTKKFSNISEIPFYFMSRSHGKSKLNIRQVFEYLIHLYRLMRD